MPTQDKEDKLDPQDPHRREMQPPIPSHPADPLAAGDAAKVVPEKPDPESGQAAPVATGVSSGPSLDQVGGPGLGEAPGNVGNETPTTTRERDTRAVDPLDKSDKP